MHAFNIGYLNRQNTIRRNTPSTQRQIIVKRESLTLSSTAWWKNIFVGQLDSLYFEWKIDSRMLTESFDFET